MNDVVLSVFMPEDLSQQDLTENPEITDFGLFLMPTSVASQLTHLYLNDCVGVSDNGVGIMASKCKQLKTLGLSGVLLDSINLIPNVARLFENNISGH